MPSIRPLKNIVADIASGATRVTPQVAAEMREAIEADGMISHAENQVMEQFLVDAYPGHDEGVMPLLNSPGYLKGSAIGRGEVKALAKAVQERFTSAIDDRSLLRPLANDAEGSRGLGSFFFARFRHNGVTLDGLSLKKELQEHGVENAFDNLLRQYPEAREFHESHGYVPVKPVAKAIADIAEAWKAGRLDASVDLEAQLKPFLDTYFR